MDMAVSRETYVSAYYWAVLGRAPDAEGFQFWTDKMSEGLSGESVVSLFLKSAERQQSHPGVDGAGDFIDGCYVDLLGRPADEGGKEYWLGRLEQLSLSNNNARAAVITEMVDYLVQPQGQSTDQQFFQSRIDQSAPIIPSLTLHHDTGVSVSDGITNDNQIDVSLPKDVSGWDYSLDGGRSWAQSSGSTLALADGRYESGSVLVRFETAGVQQTLENQSPWVMDTQAPDRLDLQFRDTGDVDNDYLTNDGYVSSPSLVGNDLWSYSIDGGLNWQAGDKSGGFAVDYGNYYEGTLQVEQRDEAGNSTVSENYRIYNVEAPPLLQSVGQASFGKPIAADQVNISYGGVRGNNFFWNRSADSFDAAFLRDVTSGEDLQVLTMNTVGRYQNVFNLTVEKDLVAGHQYSLYLPENFLSDRAGNDSPEIVLLGAVNTFVAA
ncbi:MULTISPECIES: DUF4214 domain-containing protein [unclassified Pseudomonas]|uniref:DUF4214 domain-containing protein n=1 Tax=unclassified Pseudomonas TaxID=196821 RepID=UPI002114169C|nr:MULTISPECIES: DUF4214 domain-containing protein [unclassified Pseudomonas]